ncbi:hypothetical protein B0H14DRAFT_2656491 [Mycena olivaceomarginata]|nr:hypothetical protein B0H14DRAFT_2656491 [Mycena olivaceomarginata]
MGSTAIVFKNAVSGEIYVIAAKGAFEVLTAGYKMNLANLNRKSLPFFPTESAFKNALEGLINRSFGKAATFGLPPARNLAKTLPGLGNRPAKPLPPGNLASPTSGWKPPPDDRPQLPL